MIWVDLCKKFLVSLLKNEQSNVELMSTTEVYEKVIKNNPLMNFKKISFLDVAYNNKTVYITVATENKTFVFHIVFKNGKIGEFNYYGEL